MSTGREKPAHNLQLLKVSMLVRGGSIRNVNITLYFGSGKSEISNFA